MDKRDCLDRQGWMITLGVTIVRVRDSSQGNVPCSHIIWILHLPSWSSSSWSQIANGLYFSSSEKLALIINISFDKPLFPQFHETLLNPTSRMELHALIAGVTRGSYLHGTDLRVLSLCLFPCDIYELGLSGGHPSAQDLWVLRWWQDDIQWPSSHTVEWLNGCWHTSSDVWRLLGYVLDVREEGERKESCRCLSFKLQKLIFTKHSIAGKCPALTSRVVWEVMRILRGCVSHTSAPRSPWVCQTVKLLQGFSSLVITC